MVRGIIFLLVAVGPAVIVAGLDAAGLMMAAVGDHPRWPNTHLNLSEAAAVREALLHEYPVGVGSRVVGRLWP